MSVNTNYTLIGIDCAAQPKNVGIAVGRIVDGITVIEQLYAGHPDPADVIAEAISSPALLAFDSPLGWPADLGTRLAQHQAGSRLEGEPNDLFRRETDRFVKQTVGKQSLDVGADRIARTAHAALSLLSDVRERTGLAIDVAATQHSSAATRCFEVYPAATLKAHVIDARGYKGSKPQNHDARRKLIEALETRLRIDDALIDLAIAKDDALDAAICCLAAADFIEGACFEPEDEDLAAKEGWIWVRRPDEPLPGFE